MIFAVLLSAERTAASCTSTSVQSRPSFAPVLHHALDGLQMPDGAGQAVDHRLGLGVVVVVGVLPLVGVGVLVAVGMLRLQLVGVDMAVAMVVIIELLFVFHGACFLLRST